jgi:hypothetical protein
MRAVIVIVAVLALLPGCTDARVSELMAYGDPHHIRVYSGGVLIGEWTTTGAVLNEPQSDGYLFRDAATQQMVRVSGEVIITLSRDAGLWAAPPDIPSPAPGRERGPAAAPPNRYRK